MKRGTVAIEEDSFQSQKASKGEGGERAKHNALIGSKNSDLYYLAMQNLNHSFADAATGRTKQFQSKDLTLEAEEYLCRCRDLKDQFQNIPGKVYAFGMGDSNQLGIEFDYSKPDAKSSSVKANQTAGDDSDDEDYTDKAAYVPTVLRHLEKVSNISCGAIHSAVCTDQGRVFTWGCSDEGSLGRGRPGEWDAEENKQRWIVDMEHLPMLVESLQNEHIVKVACGSSQTLALTSKGLVYEWGCYKDMENVRYRSPDPKASAAERHSTIEGMNNTPILLSDLKDIVDFACGSCFSYARSSGGEVYSWGIGECGELGRPLTTSYSRSISHKTLYDEHLRPGHLFRGDLNGSHPPGHPSTRVRFARSFACGSNHVLIVVSGGIVLSCGLNNYLQLGIETEKNEKTKAFQPNKLFFEVSSLRDKNIVSVSAGQFHSLVLSASGDIWGFGRIDYGQLGHKIITKEDYGGFTHIPTQPKIKDAEEGDVVFCAVACGDNHSLAITSTGGAYSWGYGDGGQLGLGDPSKNSDLKRNDGLLFFPQKIPFDGEILKASCGSQHSCLIGITPL